MAPPVPQQKQKIKKQSEIKVASRSRPLVSRGVSSAGFRGNQQNTYEYEASSRTHPPENSGSTSAGGLIFIGVLLVSAETSRSHPPGNEGSTSAGLTCSRQDIMLEGCSQPPPPIREGSSRDICWFPRKPADLRLAQGSASLEIRRGLLIIFI